MICLYMLIIIYHYDGYVCILDIQIYALMHWSQQVPGPKVPFICKYLCIICIQ